jgi:UDP-2,3-diacylglucosamine hydrolase
LRASKDNGLVSAYFASDVHLRLDHPERARRFARWVEGLEPGDSLTIVGDLCDFWLTARQLDAAASQCPGLRALAAFRSRGGAITILPGNHDAWLGPFYEERIGARFQPEPYEIEVHGLRVLLVHGHLLGGRSAWKGWMEGKTFLEAFRRCPAPLAAGLDHLLDLANGRHRAADEARHLAVYRKFVERCAGAADLVVLGHIHRTVDRAEESPRWIVLGGWHEQSSYLKVDASGASLIVVPDPDPASIPC